MEEKESMYHHESWHKVLRTHFRGLYVALVLKNGNKVQGKVKFTKPGVLKVNGIIISEENPIIRCFTGMNRGIIRRKSY
jgi:hypothetical protein